MKIMDNTNSNISKTYWELTFKGTALPTIRLEHIPDRKKDAGMFHLQTDHSGRILRLTARGNNIAALARELCSVLLRCGIPAAAALQAAKDCYRMTKVHPQGYAK